MIRLNNLSVIDSFNEVVPNASALGEAYLRAIARGVQECAPPVTMSLDELAAARSMGLPNLDCLVVEPTSRRLRHYRMLHYGTPMGASLKVGWFLIGGDKAEGIGFLGIGAATPMDVSDVESIVQLVHQYAVVPAINEIAGAAGFGGPTSSRQGFFNA